MGAGGKAVEGGKAVGWPDFLATVGPFCAEEDIGALTPRRTRSARLLQAARVYAASLAAVPFRPSFCSPPPRGPARALLDRHAYCRARGGRRLA